MILIPSIKVGNLFSSASFIFTFIYLNQESRHRLWTRLNQLGFNIAKDDIFSSLTSARSLIEKRHLKPYFILEDAAMEVSCRPINLNPFCGTFIITRVLTLQHAPCLFSRTLRTFVLLVMTKILL